MMMIFRSCLKEQRNQGMVRKECFKMINNHYSSTCQIQMLGKLIERQNGSLFGVKILIFRDKVYID